MTHEEIKSKLQDFLEGLVTSSEKTEIQTHLTECIDCAHELEEYNELISELNSIPELDPPANFTSQVMSRVLTQSTPVTVWDVLRHWIPEIGMAYGLGSVLVGGIGYYLYLLYEGSAWAYISWTEKLTNALVFLATGIAKLCQWVSELWIVADLLAKHSLSTFSTIWMIETVFILAGIMYWFIRRQKATNILFA